MSNRPSADVTVVVVAFRHAEYVEECLNSVLHQTVAPRQVIVMDDASPDDTAAVIARFAQAHPEIEWQLELNSENRGLCANLNRALELATQPYFAYISADDYMKPQRIDVQVKSLQESSDTVLWSYSDADRVDRSGNLLDVGFSVKYGWPRSCPQGNLFRDILSGNFVPAPSIMIRTDVLRSIGGYDPELFYEDFDMLLRLSRVGDSVCIPDKLVAFRELETSLGHQEFHSENPRFVAALHGALRKHLDIFEPEVRKQIHTKVWSCCFRLWKLNRADTEVRRDMRLSWRFAPVPWRALVQAWMATVGLRHPKAMRNARPS